MTNLTDLCITLAEKLGWENARLSGGSIVVDVAGYHRSVVVTDEDTFALIAHAKAELAKRGILIYSELNRSMVAFYSEVERDGFRTLTSPYTQDPTNPLSTAEAELKAMIEALS